MQKLAEWLANDDRVAWVKYPGLKDDPDHELAKKYLRGTSGVLPDLVRVSVDLENINDIIADFNQALGTA